MACTDLWTSFIQAHLSRFAWVVRSKSVFGPTDQLCAWVQTVTLLLTSSKSQQPQSGPGAEIKGDRIRERIFRVSSSTRRLFSFRLGKHKESTVVLLPVDPIGKLDELLHIEVGLSTKSIGSDIDCKQSCSCVNFNWPLLSSPRKEDREHSSSRAAENGELNGNGMGDLENDLKIGKISTVNNGIRGEYKAKKF